MAIRGTSAVQDSRFYKHDKKLLAKMNFPKCFSERVDLSKVQREVINQWITERITELLGFEDDIVISMAINLLEPKEVDEKLDPKQLQLALTGFLEKQAAAFTQELWELLLSAQSNATGIPSAILDKKKQEMETIAAEKNKLKEVLDAKRADVEEAQRGKDRKLGARQQPNTNERRSAGRGDRRAEPRRRSRSLQRRPRSPVRRSRSPRRRFRSPPPRRSPPRRRERSPRRRSRSARRRSFSPRRRSWSSPRGRSRRDRSRSPSVKCRRRRSPSRSIDRSRGHRSEQRRPRKDSSYRARRSPSSSSLSAASRHRSPSSSPSPPRRRSPSLSSSPPRRRSSKSRRKDSTKGGSDSD